MKIKKLLKSALIAVAIFSAINSNAQDVRQYNSKNSFWSELNFIGNISKKFTWQLDFQYRFQSEQQYYQPNANLNN
ncbi:MAG: hypothetical protein ACXVC7_12090, partial [Bacteroidia bacterium]